MAGEANSTGGWFHKWIWIPVVGTIITFAAKTAYDKYVEPKVKQVTGDNEPVAQSAPQAKPQPAVVSRPPVDVPDGKRTIVDD